MPELKMTTPACPEVPTVISKLCKKCGEVKPLGTEFRLNKLCRDGHEPSCRRCRNAEANARYAAKRAAGSTTDRTETTPLRIPACIPKKLTPIQPIIPAKQMTEDRGQRADGRKYAAGRRSHPSSVIGSLSEQVGGDHYKHFQIQPIEFSTRNNLGFIQGCVVKRICRYNLAGGKGIQDLEKIIHEVNCLIEISGLGKAEGHAL